MKKLILSLCVVTSTLHADEAPRPEIVNPDDGKSIVSVIKDFQVQEMLDKTTEFQDCRDKNKFDAADDEKVKTRKIQEAEKCIQDKLSKGDKNGEKLKELSDTLNLQHYGLVQSKNVSDIKKYLADKMYQSMTGVDRNNQNAKALAESLKFKNKKHIDQKVFVEIYRTQLGKNALFEISRFCFENLRSEDADSVSKATFSEHWAKYVPGSLIVNEERLNINDSGIPVFGKTLSGPEDKDQVYKEIFNSIQGDGSPLDEKQMSSFFMDCAKTIAPLCNYFKRSSKVDLKNTQSQVDSGKTGSSTGAAACLAESRIRAYRKGIADAQKIEADFDKLAEGNELADSLLSGEPIKRFQPGQDKNDTIDDLTNFSSKDVLEGGYSKDATAEQKSEECAKNPELASCESFISEGDDLDKAKHNLEMELTIKRQVEMTRVRELDEKNLKEYLEENGHFDLLKDDLYTTLTKEKLAEAIGKFYEAKKIATLEQINKKLGKRQVSKDADSADISTNAKEVIQESKEERSRLAQVVLFNNIITSYVPLTRRDSSGGMEDAGRNVNAWKNEEDDLSNSNIDQSLFQNIKTSSDGVKTMGKDESIGSFEVLDTILGKQ